MKKRFFLILLAVIAVGGVGYAARGWIRDAWGNVQRPILPVAARYNPAAVGATDVAGDQTSPVEGGVATSQHFILVSSPTVNAKKIDPFADKGALPAEANLAVPFMSQAPIGDWSYPYQEACEEATTIMVDAYYRNVTSITPDQGTKAINAVVDYENATLGFYKDTTAAQTAQFVKGFFKYQDVVVAPLTDVSQIKRAVANGFPVIIPADGRKLHNPNFRNGGPAYHMVVVKGYTADKIITNDPGTHNGADYVYDPATLMSAAHDWNGKDAADAPPVMIIILPNPQT